jgi:phage gpG-like protein
MNDLQFGISLNGFEEHLNTVKLAEDRFNDLSKPMEITAKYMLRRIETGFKNSHTPYGKPWEDIKDLTIITRKKNKEIDQPLVDTGALRKSFNYDVGQNFLTIGSNNVTAEEHQYGFEDIPQRMMIPTSEIGLPDLWSKKALIELTKYLLKDEV